MNKKLKWYLFLQVFMLSVSMLLASYCLVSERYLWAALALIVVALYVVYIYQAQLKVYNEIKLFTEGIRYRDFSRRSKTAQHSPMLKVLHEGFNEINSVFKAVSRERETHYHNLHQVLEMVDTGILSYEAESGEVVWMNETSKQLLQIPYLKAIHALEKRNPELYQQIISLKPGQSKVGSVFSEKVPVKVLLSASSFSTNGKLYHLIALQNIHEALDETEAKAWQKLLSVLTHEIMNSIAPISSLAGTIKNSLAAVDRSLHENGFLDDLELGIGTIKSRSEGLLRFAETYRNLNRVAQPDRQKFYVRDLFEDLFTLMQPTLKQKNIELAIILKDPNLNILADFNLLEQVMINLLLNAIEAVKDSSDPRIALHALSSSSGKVLIKVEDNGCGIPDDVLDKVFVPFFSTKKSGSGIGLTLCKQIMLMHDGNIQVQSTLGSGTVFSLIF